MLLLDRALETVYITAGIGESVPEIDYSIRDRLTAAEVGPDDFALIQTPEITLLTTTHRVDPVIGISTIESGAIGMRTLIRPDEIDRTPILLYHIGSTAELLARATLWPFYGIKAEQWLTEADGSAAVTIVDGLDALEPVEAGFSTDLVRAWYILTEQPVVTHLLVVPTDATDADVDAIRSHLDQARDSGYRQRRDLRRMLLEESAIENEWLVDTLGRVRYDLDDTTRAAAYSLIARGCGGTRFPLIREIPWWESGS